MKMKRAIKVVSIVIAATMSLTLMMTGCGSAGESTQTEQSNESSAQSTSSAEKTTLEPVTLSWYFPWTQQADQNIVWDEVNKTLQEKINATIDFKPVDWGTWNDKMSMVLASGDDWDIVFSCNWQKGANYQSSVSKGAFLALDDLIAQYAPTLKAYPQKYWDCTKINNKIYGVFNMQTETNQWGGYFNKNIVDKLKIEDTLNNVKKLEDIEPMLEAVKQDDPSVYVLGDMSQVDGAKFFQEGYLEVLVTSDIYINKNDQNLKAVNIYEEPFITDYQNRKSDWYKKGYIKKDQITVQTWDPIVTAGKVFMFGATIKPGGDVEASNRYSQPFTIKSFGTAMVNPNGPTSTMQSINAKCKNPERAMMVFELMNTDKNLFNTMAFGLEGQHYSKIDDNTVEIQKDSKYSPGCAWEFGNVFNGFIMKGQPADVWEQTQKLNDEAEANPLTGFTFNSEAVKTEVANIDGVKAKYESMLLNGAGGDMERLLKDYNEGVKKAGMEKVLAEIQKQIDAFKAAKK